LPVSLVNNAGTSMVAHRAAAKAHNAESKEKARSHVRYGLRCEKLLPAAAR